jgi:hypothetical protein
VSRIQCFRKPIKKQPRTDFLQVSPTVSGAHGRQVFLVRPATFEETLDIAENTIQVLVQEARQHAFYTVSEAVHNSSRSIPRNRKANPHVHAIRRLEILVKNTRNVRHPTSTTRLATRSPTLSYSVPLVEVRYITRVCEITRPNEASSTHRGRCEGQGQSGRFPPQARSKQPVSRQNTNIVTYYGGSVHHPEASQQ